MGTFEIAKTAGNLKPVKMGDSQNRVIVLYADKAHSIFALG